MPRVFPFLLLFLPACQPGYLVPFTGDFGIAFSGDPDCLEVDASSLELVKPLTLDLYLQAELDDSYALHPVVVLPGAFALYQDEEGYLLVSPTESLDPSSSAGTLHDMLDGHYHHLSFTVAADDMATLYLDGRRMGQAYLDLFSAPGETLYFGCWPGKDVWFHGTIGEARLYAGLAHDGDFTPEWLPYELDEQTIALWHFDEGTGPFTQDERGRANGELTGGEWVEFPLEGEPPGAAGGDAEDTGGED